MNIYTLLCRMFLGAFLLATLCPAADPVPLPRPAETLREFNEKRNGTIVVEGAVVDGEGNPVSDVTAYIDRRIEQGIEGKRDQYKEVVNGTFRFRFVGNSNVEITFRRKGYHAADCSASVQVRPTDLF